MAEGLRPWGVTCATDEGGYMIMSLCEASVNRGLSLYTPPDPLAGVYGGG